MCSAPDLSSRLGPSCSFQSLERLIIEVTCTWTMPSLPALRDLSISCEHIGSSSILIDLTTLPRLSSFELEEYAGEGLTLLGSSQTVRKICFTISNIELSFLQNLGQNIEEIDLFTCVMHLEHELRKRETGQQVVEPTFIRKTVPISSNVEMKGVSSSGRALQFKCDSILSLLSQNEYCIQ